MSIKDSIKDYWRIYLLTIVTIISLTIIFSPVVPGLELTNNDITDEDDDDIPIDQKYTNLQYSIELAGGTRIRAPLIGLLAEGVDIGDNEIAELEQSLADDFDGTSERDISVYTPSEDSDDIPEGNTTIEITSEEIPKHEEFSDSLEKNDVTYNNIKDGVTDETRDETVDVLQSKLDEAGLSGGSVRYVELNDGTEVILVSVPDIDREGTLELIQERGEVNIEAYYQNSTTNDYEQDVVLTQDDFRTVGSPQTGDDVNPPHVPVTLDSTSATEFQTDVVDAGIAQPGGTECRYDEMPNQTDPCLLTVVDGEVIYSAGMSPSLADDMFAGTWSDDPRFILQTSDYEEAQSLSVNLRAGVMPAQLDIDNGEISFISPEQGDQYRLWAFIIGVIATLTVATSISLRYGNVKIAAPMLITAFTEVIILAALASLLSYPIDTAVIAGFIAVIGTGVDDLIIIADRVMGGRNPASSERIFERRFRKALWIIMGAAGTTILALAPLAILDLQALQGFAIFTIVGVIAGVLITRPAYGDMLRYLFTDK